MVMSDYNSYITNKTSSVSNGSQMYPYSSDTKFYDNGIVNNLINQMISYLPEDTTLTRVNKKTPEDRKDNNDMFNFGNFFNGMFAPIKDKASCKL